VPDQAEPGRSLKALSAWSGTTTKLVPRLAGGGSAPEYSWSKWSENF